jgi:hypothetical protein
MNLCHQAISALTQNSFELLGEPTTEQEFLLAYKEGIGVDETGTVIFSSDPADFSVTWSEVNAKKSELESDHTAKQYQRDRAKAYPSIADQLDMQYHDKINGTTTWADAIQDVKDKYPKPE